MDKVVGALMMAGGVVLGFFSLPPATWFSLLMLISGALLFIGGIEVIRNPSTRNGA